MNRRTFLRAVTGAMLGAVAAGGVKLAPRVAPIVPAEIIVFSDACDKGSMLIYRLAYSELPITLDGKQINITWDNQRKIFLL